MPAAAGNLDRPSNLRKSVRERYNWQDCRPTGDPPEVPTHDRIDDCQPRPIKVCLPEPLASSPRRGATFESVVPNPRPAAILFLCVPGDRARDRRAAVHRAGPAGGARHAGPADGEVHRPAGDADEQYARMRDGGRRTARTSRRSAIFVVRAGRRRWSLPALYFVIFNAILGGTATFKQVLAIVTHSQVISALGAAIGARRSVHHRARCLRRGRSISARWCRCSSENSFLVAVPRVHRSVSRLGHHRDRDRSRRALQAQERQHRDRAAHRSTLVIAGVRRRVFSGR